MVLEALPPKDGTSDSIASNTMLPTTNGGGRRSLPYDALDPKWEACELQKFRVATGNARQQVPYDAYLFGRLMQSDLHQSCLPALPPAVSKLNGFTIQGTCILQVIDVANIGANYEHRTTFSAAGSTRTLKLGLTDGHQIVFGFEFTSLPQFSVNVPRGTKIVVENVPVRHGLLLLAPDNCQLLEAPSDYSRRSNEQVQQRADSNGTGTGAYSAALVTSQFNASHKQMNASPSATAQQSIALSLAMTSAPGSIAQEQMKSTKVSTSSHLEPARRTSNVAVGTVSSISDPAVFVDVPSSDEDMDSDATDPMVEHLFYSPKTPRYPADVADMESIQESSTRKRSSSQAIEEEVGTEPSLQLKIPRIVDKPVTVAGYAPSLSLADQAMTTATTCASMHPFQYFQAKLPTLSAPIQPGSFRIRACIKSVVGFQYNTGRYQLRVSVEDCTATKEADVAEDFVTRLMGVPCSEFLQTMQTEMQVAHGWAATMQFALMNLEGVMTFKTGEATSPGSLPLLLVDCRDFQPSDTRDLLQRVKASLLKAISKGGEHEMDYMVKH